MKKFLLLCLCLITYTFANAQTEEEKFIYAEIVGTGKLFSSKVTVNIDYGQSTSFWNPNKNSRLLDENGKPITFNSMVDAMNFMGMDGWEFLQAYVVTVQNQNVYHWLLKKNVKDFDERDEIMTKFKDSTTKKE